ncbi:MAG: GldM family protein [Bacteroidales bacterium]|jgi:gliding motility-associated protein GldM
MKTICLIFSLLMIPFIVKAQESGKDAVVSATKMNVLYRGVPNPIGIAVPGVASDKITATINDGTIKKVTNGWEVIPGLQSESVITVLVNNSKVSEKTFRVKDIPQPVAVFAGIHGGIVPKDLAMKTGEIEAKLIDFAWDLKFEIVSFNFYLTTPTGDIEYSSDGNKLTDNMKSCISNSKSGQTIVFKNIKAKAPDGKVFYLDSIVIKLN